MEKPLKSYQIILLYFTRRVLTNQGDALSAMAGIMRRFLEKLKYSMLEGLPTGTFDQFILCWGINLYFRHGFPSYSWADWRGGISVNIYRRLNDWLANRTWIIWFRRSPSG